MGGNLEENPGKKDDMVLGEKIIRVAQEGG